MLTAMTDVVAERGVTNVTVAHVVARSGVSRRTFYEVFEDREDCFLAAFDDAVQRAASRVLEAHGSAGRWRERIRASLTGLLVLLEEEPNVGRLLIVESLAAGPAALRRRQDVLARLTQAVEEGRSEAKAGPGPPPLTAEGVVGGVCSVLHGRLVEESSGRLVELVNPLMSMIVLPYLGAAVARKELERPLPRLGETSHRTPSDPLRDLGMRLTYRTVRVLTAVAGNPDSSNRTLADAAGISDQGQMSKLLARLRGLGLIENTGTGPARGEPNAWRLTGRGTEVHGAIAHQASGA
jgi:AcrR family transcriptional regulator